MYAAQRMNWRAIFRPNTRNRVLIDTSSTKIYPSSKDSFAKMTFINKNFVLYADVETKTKESYLKSIYDKLIQLI